MSDLLSSFELKQLRKAIGASLARMAQLLGLSGQNDANTVRDMENGSLPISGPLQRIAKFMQEGVADGALTNVLPEFIIGGDLEDEISTEWVFHTRYPRFLAVVTEKPIDNLVCATVDHLEWLSVAMWIDEPVADPMPFVQKAAELFSEYTNESLQ